MGFKPAKCPNCAGELHIPEERDVVKCMYCGVDIVVREAISKVKSGPTFENFIILAESAVEAKQPTKAVQYYDKALEINPTSSEAWYGKGFNSENYNEAAMAFKNSIKLAAENEREIIKDKAFHELFRKLFSHRMHNNHTTLMNNLQLENWKKTWMDSCVEHIELLKMMYEMGFYHAVRFYKTPVIDYLIDICQESLKGYEYHDTRRDDWDRLTYWDSQKNEVEKILEWAIKEKANKTSINQSSSPTDEHSGSNNQEEQAEAKPEIVVAVANKPNVAIDNILEIIQTPIDGKDENKKRKLLYWVTGITLIAFLVVIIIKISQEISGNYGVSEPQAAQMPKAEPTLESRVDSDRQFSHVSGSESFEPILGKLDQKYIKALEVVGFKQNNEAAQEAAEAVWGHYIKDWSKYKYGEFSFEEDGANYSVSLVTTNGSDVIAMEIAGDFIRPSSGSNLAVLRLVQFFTPLQLINDKEVEGQILDLIKSAIAVKIYDDGLGRFPDRIFKGYRIHLEVGSDNNRIIMILIIVPDKLAKINSKSGNVITSRASRCMIKNGESPEDFVRAFYHDLESKNVLSAKARWRKASDKRVAMIEKSANINLVIQITDIQTDGKSNCDKADVSVDVTETKGGGTGKSSSYQLVYHLYALGDRWNIDYISNRN